MTSWVTAIQVMSQAIGNTLAYVLSIYSTGTPALQYLPASCKKSPVSEVFILTTPWWAKTAISAHFTDRKLRHRETKAQIHKRYVSTLLPVTWVWAHHLHTFADLTVSCWLSVTLDDCGRPGVQHSLLHPFDSPPLPSTCTHYIHGHPPHPSQKALFYQNILHSTAACPPVTSPEWRKRPQP